MAPKLVSKSLMKSLSAYAWPGNIRQLENEIKRAFVLSEGGELQLSDFNFKNGKSTRSEDGDIPVRAQESLSLGTMEAMERQMMEKALQLHGHNVTQAAKALGVAKSTFYRKMKTHNIV